MDGPILTCIWSALTRLEEMKKMMMMGGKEDKYLKGDRLVGFGKGAGGS